VNAWPGAPLVLIHAEHDVREVVQLGGVAQPAHRLLAHQPAVAAALAPCSIVINDNPRCNQTRDACRSCLAFSVPVRPPYHHTCCLRPLHYHMCYLLNTLC
jgi:hypothetical protein